MSRGLGDKKDGIAILDIDEVTLLPSLTRYKKDWRKYKLRERICKPQYPKIISVIRSNRNYHHAACLLLSHPAIPSGRKGDTKKTRKYLEECYKPALPTELPCLTARVGLEPTTRGFSDRSNSSDRHSFRLLLDKTRKLASGVSKMPTFYQFLLPAPSGTGGDSNP